MTASFLFGSILLLISICSLANSYQVHSYLGADSSSIRIMRSLWILTGKRQHSFSSASRYLSTMSSTISSIPSTTIPTASNGDKPTRTKEKSTVPSTPPIVAHVAIDRNIMDHLQLRSNQRKSRFLLSTKQIENTTVSQLRNMIESRVAALTAKPYRLQYKLHNDQHNLDEQEMYLTTLTSDEEIQQAIQQSMQTQKSLQLFVKGVVGSFPPVEASDPYALRADPLESPSFTMVSFFSFHPISQQEEVAEELRQLWKPFHALGRVYIAKEGINAQMAIPTNVFEDFTRVTKLNVLFAESRFNTDPAVSKEEYLQMKPFRALHIRIREQIVADGLNEALDWKQAGNELEPLAWHKALDDPNAIILDCRNTYETDVGIFDNAIPLNTTFFRESWVALEEVLKDKPKDAPVYTYCTGGIRCVKINAFLEQKMGFSNTHRLKGGVIAYRRELENQSKSSPSSSGTSPEQKVEYASKFKGVNYVFDERIVERITEDVFTHCETCGAVNDAFTNCKSYACNVRFVQCSNCRTRYQNCCSEACKMDFNLAQESDTLEASLHNKVLQKKNVKNMSQGNMLNKASRDKLNELSRSPSFSSLSSTPSSDNEMEALEIISTTKPTSEPAITVVKTHALEDGNVVEALNQYCEKFSEQEPPVLQRLRQLTTSSYTHGAARMISSASQGALLSFLASLNCAKTVLELGSFTGFSALSLALDYDIFSNKQSVGQSGGDLSLTSSRKVFTCEIDPKAAGIAKDFFQQSGIGDSITLHSLPGFEMIAKMKEDKMKFDMVFIDADKKKYVDYMKQIMGEDEESSLLNHGALVVVDNTLWKGLVLQHTEEWKEFTPNAEEFGSKDRFQKLAEIMHDFNTFVASHDKLRTLLLPIRDGLTVMRYIGNKKE